MKTLFHYVLYWAVSLAVFSDPSKDFRCEAMLPQVFQVPALESCNQNIVYVPADVESKYNTPYFDVYITDQALKNNNMGAMVLHLPKQEKKIIYRSASLAGSPFCLYELYSKRQVTTIINLIDRTIGHAQFLKALEEDEFRAIGGEWYLQVFHYGIEPGTTVDAQFFAVITDIIKQIIHAKGDVLIHCLSGEHDTGVIFALLQKCYNKIPIKVIKTNALCHIGPLEYQYQRESYKIVSQVIDEYPCNLLVE